MMSTRVLTRAVMVVRGTSEHLAASLSSLSDQTVIPDLVDIVVAHPGDVEVPPRLRAQVTTVPAGTYQEMLDAFLSATPALPDEYLWLLHDDTAVMPDVLALLTATARKRRRAAVIGAAHVEWEHPDVLINMGITVSRWGARRVELNAAGDVNQGQYANRDDVLAVSLAGALVRRDAYHQLGGLDPVYSGFGDSIELCRRAWHAGYDVVVVPRARIRHAQETWRGLRADGLSTSARMVRARVGEWYHALVWAPWWMIGFLIIAALLAVVPRMMVRIAQNHAGLAVAEWAVPWALAARLPHVRKSRAHVRSLRAVDPASWRGLLAGPAAVLSYVRVRHGGTLVRSAGQRPTDVIREELQIAARRRRIVAAGVMAASVGVGAVTSASWIGAVITGQSLVVPGLGVATARSRDLWQEWWTGYSSQDLGLPAIDGAFAALMLPLSAVPSGVAVLLVAAVPLATWSAWVAWGSINRAVTVRALAALAYGWWPLLIESAGHAHVGAVIVHVLLPWVVWGAVHSVGAQAGEVLGDGHEYPERRRASPSAGMAAAVALAAVAAAAPIVAVAGSTVAIVAAVAVRRARWRLVTLTIPALAVVAPTMVAAWRWGLWSDPGLRLLLRQPGAGTNGDGAVLEASSYLVNGSVTAIGLVAIVMVVAVVSLAGVVMKRVVAHASVGMVIVGWGAAITVAAWRTHPSDPSIVSPSVGLSMAWCGALIVFCATMKRFTQPVEAHGPRGSARTAASTSIRAKVVAVGAAAAMVLGIGAQATVTLVLLRDELVGVEVGDTQVLPLVAHLEMETPLAPRVLVIDASPDEPWLLAITVLRTDGTSLLVDATHRGPHGEVWARPESEPSRGAELLAQPVAQIAAGSTDGADLLTDWGVGIVIIPSSATSVAALEQHPHMSLIGASERGTTWRVVPDDRVSVSRAWLKGDDGTVVALPWRNGSVRTAVQTSQAGTVVLATPSDRSWSATIDGVALTPVEDQLGRVAFHLPQANGVLEVRYRDGSYEWWKWLTMLLMGWAAIAAIPLGSPWRTEHQ